MARFLSDEYLAEAAETLSSHSGFREAINGVDLSLQFHVTDVPDKGQVDYALVIGDGAASVTSGEVEEADVTVTNDYDTAAGISKGDLNTQMAFMTGKIKVGGNMAALLMNQAVITEFANALSTLDVEY